MPAISEAPSRVHVQTPRVFRPLLSPSRYKGAYGGRGSGKSWAFADLLIERCLLTPTRAVCIREYQVSLEQSVKRLLEDVITRWGVTARFSVKATHIETPAGGRIIFQGMQNHTADSIKSLEAYTVAWVEEAQTLSQRSLDLLRPTIREPDSELWFSWNPSQPTDPIDALLRGPSPPDDTVLCAATYRDNPWFPEVLEAEMAYDRDRDPEKYAHVWLGEYERHSEARVFRNWRVAEFETPATAIFYLGADWGYAVDPTVLIRCWVQGRMLYIDGEVYRVGCEIDHLPQLFDTLDDGMARQWPIRADSARPETIAYLQRHGYPKLRPARKGPASVKEGIIFLQSYDLVVHPRCRHTIDELTMYRYRTDPLTGIVTPQLMETTNHVIDALRYAVEQVRQAYTGAAPSAVGEQASYWRSGPA